MTRAYLPIAALAAAALLPTATVAVELPLNDYPTSARADYVFACMQTNGQTREALDKLAEAGIKRSVMLINGLGGEKFSRPHALNSAALMNATQPEFLATLVVSFPKGEGRLRAGFPDWEPLSVVGLMQEVEMFVSALELKRTVFRSDHASNWLVLKGTLGADKPRLLQELRAAITAPEAARLRPAWARGL